MSVVTIANKVMTITTGAGTEDTRNLVFGRYFSDPTAGYIEITTITQEKIRLIPSKITNFNGTAGAPAFSTVITALLANIKS